ncbi:MAG TPA: NAD(P)-dependent oxidoreductase [Gemmatimonadaceae bacterium]|jgi:nucleoside-diphosphate-sugar epimerase
MRIFVAGATGVIGRRVVPQLIDAGHRVTAVGRTPEKQNLLTKLGATPVMVDLFDSEDVGLAVEGHDVVINLATKIPPSSRAFMPGAWRDNTYIRRFASGNLARAASATRAERFIQESFAPIYADAGDGWIDEQSPVKVPKYARAVLDAEAAAAGFTERGGIGIVLRFAFFYGPDSGYLIDTIKMVRKGFAPTFGKAESFMSSVSHDDAATGVIAALGARKGVYNVSDDEPLTRREYIDSLAAALGVKPPRIPPAFIARLLGSVGEVLSRSQRISNKKLKNETGWTPVFPSVREGWKVSVGT